jgi:hypothetical protein
VVKAERLVDADSGQPVGKAPQTTAMAPAPGDPVTLETLPMNATNKWKYLKIGVIALGVLLLAGGAAFVLRGRRQGSR